MKTRTQLSKVANPRDHAVLLLHGLGGSPVEMTSLTRHLEKLGYFVYCPVLPGHTTSVADLKSRKWTEWRSAALEAFEKLESKYSNVSVGGICMGAVLALLLASELGSRVTATISISTTLYYDGWGLPWYRIFRGLAYHTPLVSWYELEEGDPFGVKNERVRRWIAKHMTADSKTHYSKIPGLSFYEMEKLIAVTKKKIPSMCTPLLAIHPIEDDVTSLRSVRFLEKHVKPQLLQKLLLDDSYHLATIDNQKELLAVTAAEFLERVVPTSTKKISEADKANEESADEKSAAIIIKTQSFEFKDSAEAAV